MKTKRRNYSAWKVDRTEFNDSLTTEEKLKFFAKYAVLAPSGHNTQPWLFEFKKDAAIISVNETRNLPHSGKVAAEPYVSIGSCLETLLLAAEGFGYSLKTSISYIPKLKITASIEGKVKPDNNLLDAIVGRVSNREYYSVTPIDTKKLSLLTNSSRAKIRKYSLAGEKSLKFLATKTSEATIDIMSDPAFRKELSGWVRNNLTRQYDGMPAFVQGMPTPPSLIAKHIIKNIDISKTQAKKDSLRVINSGAVIALCLSDSSERSFLNLGREYANICIKAQSIGLASSGVGAAVIAKNSKQEIKKFLNTDLTPAALIRIGIPLKKARKAPRLPLEKVTI